MSFQPRAAVIGTGFIGPVHIEGLRRAGVSVLGVLGSSAAKSQHAAQRLAIPRAYRSLTELLADREVDVVHITTPNQQHFEQAAQSLAAGKHVVCEKPLAMNAQESAELVKRAEDSGRLAAVNYNIRYYPLCIEAATRIRSGAIGAIHHIAGSYVQDWLLRETDFNWRLLAEQGGELRAMADIGTHWLDLIQYIIDQPIVAVCADLFTALPLRKRPLGNVETFSGKLAANAATEPIQIKTDDYGAVMFRTRDGARGVLWVSQVTAGRKNCLRFEIAGTQQAFAWESEKPNEMWIGHRDEPNQLLIRDPALLSPAARHHAEYPGGHNEGFPDTFKQFCRDFYGQLARGDFKAKPTFPTFRDGHREIVLCEAILRSHRERSWVDVPQSS